MLFRKKKKSNGVNGKQAALAEKLSALDKTHDKWQEEITKITSKVNQLDVELEIPEECEIFQEYIKKVKEISAKYLEDLIPEHAIK